MQSSGAFGILPRDARDIGAADADVGEFSVTETGKLLEAVAISLHCRRKRKKCARNMAVILLKDQQKSN